MDDLGITTSRGCDTNPMGCTHGECDYNPMGCTHGYSHSTTSWFSKLFFSRLREAI
jgi:hypothetical protein